MNRWEHTYDVGGRVHVGSSAVVIDVVRQDGSPAAPRMSWTCYEATFENIALRAWDGAGMIRLEAAEAAEEFLTRSIALAKMFDR